MANEYDQILDGEAKPSQPATAYDQILNDDKSIQRDSMAQAAVVAKNLQPDRHAQVLDLSTRMNLPPDIVDRNFDDLQAKQRVNETDYNAIIDKTPEFAKWLENKDNAALASDDHDAIGALEENVKEHGFLSQMYNSLGHGLAAVGGDIGKIPALAYDVGAMPYNKAVTDLGHADQQVRAPEWLSNNVMTRYYDRQAQAFADNAPALHESIIAHARAGRWEKAGQSMAAQLVSSSPQLAALVVGSMAGMAPAVLAEMGVTTAASADFEASKTGVTPLQSTSDALLKGAIATETGRLGTFGALTSWENAIARIAGKQGSKQVMMDFAKTLLYSVARGEAQGGTMSLANDFADYMTGVNPDAMTGSMDRAIDQGFVMAATDVGMAGPGLAMDTQVRSEMARKTALDQNFYRAMGDSAEATKLRKRLPDAQRKFVEQVTRDTPVENLYISPEAADVYFQNKGLNPVTVMSELGALPEYGAAKEAGTDMKIPLAKWVDKVVGTDHYKGLENDIKFDPQDLSINEQKVETKRLEEEAAKPQQMDQAIADEHAAAVGDEVRSQLEAAGHDPKAAAVIEHGMRTLAERTGQDPQELFKQLNLRISNGDVQPIGTGDQTYEQPSRTHLFTVKDTEGTLVLSSPGVKMSASARVVGSTMKIESLNTDPKYGGTTQDMLRSLEKVALSKNSTNITALDDNLSASDIKAFHEQGYERVVTVDGPMMVKDLTRSYNQDKENAAPFYSKLQQTIEQKMGGSQDTKSLRAMLKDIRPEEMKWSGLDDLLKSKEKVTKQEVLDHLAANQLQIKEVTKSSKGELSVDESQRLLDLENKHDDAGLTPGEHTELNHLQTRNEGNESDNTKFSKYTLPGGDNYREVLFQMPPAPEDAGKIELENSHKIAKEAYDVNNLNMSDSAKQLRTDLNANRTLKTKGIEGKDVMNRLSWLALEPKADWNDERKAAWKETTDQLSKTKLWKDVQVVLEFKLESQKLFNDYNTAEKALRAAGSDYASYRSSHFDEANVLAHTRLNDRIDADGKKILHVEEIQSDWHQAGRKKGYSGGATELPPGYTLFHDTSGNGDHQWQIHDQDKRIAGFGKTQEAALADFDKVTNKKVPDAPFKKTWHEFVLKRLIRMAAEQGYDKISWTTGEQQNDRYDLSKQVHSLSYEYNKEHNRFAITGEDNEGKHHSFGVYEANALDEVVGKDMADKMIKHQQEGNTKGDFSGAQLKVGGEGMKGFYDKIIPDFMRKFGKKFGTSVEDTKLKNLSMDEVMRNGGKQPGQQTVHSMDITPQLRDAALNEGFSLFQGGDENNPRGQIHIGQDGIRISLLKDANASTALHEFGHFYVEVMSKLASAEGATDQIKQDFKLMREFSGAEEGQPIQVEHHEKLARAFEAYLMEGKAPSEGLRKAFANFKVWLTNIYKKMRNLNVELSPEIRGVFDRILATDKEIADAQEKQNYKPIFSDPAIYGLSPDDFAKYQSAIDAAKLAADDTLRAKVMKDITQTKTAMYKEDRARVHNEIDQQANQTRVFKARSLLQLDKMPDGSPRPEGSPKLKLDRSSLVKQYGKEILEKLPRMYAKDGGMDHNIVAEMLGYESGDQMVQEIVNSQPKADYVEQQVEARMKDMYPDMLDSGQMADEAMAAIHSDKQAAVLRMELEFLARDNMPVLKGLIKRVAKRVPTDQQVRADAEKTISRMNVRELKPGQYKSAEARHAREAGEKLTKGDIDGAFESKRLELYNHELYKSVTEAKEDVQKSLKAFRRVAKPDADLAKTRDTNLVAAARAILAAYGIGKTDASPASYLEKLRRYDPENYAAAHSLVEMATAEGSGNYNEIPYDRFTVMRDTVKGIWDLAKSSQQITIDGKKVSRQGILDGLSARISDMSPQGPRAGYEKALTGWEKTKIQLMSWKASLRRVESWVTAIDGGHKGLFRTAIWNPITEAATKFRLAKYEVMKDYLDNVVKPVESTFNNKTIDAPEINYQFKNKAQLLGALLHTGNESNFSKLLRGRGWGTMDEEGNIDSTRWDKMVDRLQRDGTLTKQDYDYVQNVWNLYEKLKPDSQKAHKAMYGAYFDEITAKKFQTPFGEYEGGYAPAIADPNMSEDQSIRLDKDQIEKNNNSYMFPTTGRGFTKSRVEGYAAPLAIDLEYVPMQIDKVLRFTHIEPSVKEVARLVNDKAFRTVLSGLDPVVASEMLIPWLQRSAQQQTSTPSQGKAWKGFDYVMRKARGNTGLNAMVGNLVNVLHQTTGLPMIMTLVSPHHFRDAMWGYLKDAKGTSEMMREKSDYMRAKEHSVNEIQSDLNDIIMNPSKYDKVKDFIRQNGYILQRMTAGMVENVAWQSGYRQGTEKGMSEKEAVRFADDVVRQTQHSSHPEEISRFGTGTPFMRAFTMYFDYYNMKANLIGTEAGNVYREMGMAKGSPALAYIYATGFMMPAVMAAAYYHAAGGRLDANDDHHYMDDVLKIFFGGQLADALALAPVIGPITNNFLNRFNDNKADDRISVSPVFKNLERVLGTPKEIHDALTKNGRKSGAIKDTLSLLGMFTGLPLEPLARPIGYLSDVNQGYARPTGPIDYTRGVLTGNAGRPHK